MAINKIPNFFIVGAEKAGTTSIYNYLSQHLDIFLCPIKEPNHFSTDLTFPEISKIDINKYLSNEILETKHIAHVTELKQYNALFRGVKNEKMIGESSVSYLFSKEAAKNIYEYNSKAKIIIILRNPVDRAFSEYKMDLGIGRVKTSFLQASGLNSKYIDKSMYYAQVKKYYNIFPLENIKIILFDDFKNNPDFIIKELFDFLQVSGTVNVDKKKSNESIAPKSVYINYILNKSGLKQIIRIVFPYSWKENLKKKYYKKSKIKLTSEEYEYLKKVFEEDIVKLSSLINEDLSIWNSESTNLRDN